MDPLHSLIRESLNQRPLGQSKNFEWFITKIGIAALVKGQNKNISSYDPIKEAFLKGILTKSSKLWILSIL